MPNPPFHLLQQIKLHGYYNQSQKGSEGQPKNNGPRQWPPEDNVVAANVDFRIKTREERKEIDIQPNG